MSEGTGEVVSDLQKNPTDWCQIQIGSSAERTGRTTLQDKNPAAPGRSKDPDKTAIVRGRTDTAMERTGDSDVTAEAHSVTLVSVTKTIFIFKYYTNIVQCYQLVKRATYVMS